MNRPRTENGRWRIGEQIGGGGQATTHLAWDEQNPGREAVAKRFVLPGASSWKPFELFEREVRILQTLRHPQIPRFLDAFEGTVPGTFFLVMDKVGGASLDVVRRSTSFETHELCDILLAVLDVLQYLHNLHPPVIHRDVKPANLVRDDQGKVHLVDFGGARDRLRSEGGSTVVGTFGYMAPEQLYGHATPATDLFALGMTIASLASGLEPEQIPRRGLRLHLGALLGHRDLAEVLQGMTEPDPEHRIGAVEVGRRVLEIRQSTARRRLVPTPQCYGIAVIIHQENEVRIGRIVAFVGDGCTLDIASPAGVAAATVELVLQLEGVEVEGSVPMRLERAKLVKEDGGKTRVVWPKLTASQHRWLRGAKTFAALHD